MGTPVEHGNWTTAIRYDRNGDSMASIAIPLTIPPKGIVPWRNHLTPCFAGGTGVYTPLETHPESPPSNCALQFRRPERQN